MRAGIAEITEGVHVRRSKYSTGLGGASQRRCSRTVAVWQCLMGLVTTKADVNGTSCIPAGLSSAGEERLLDLIFHVHRGDLAEIERRSEAGMRMSVIEEKHRIDLVCRIKELKAVSKIYGEVEDRQQERES